MINDYSTITIELHIQKTKIISIESADELQFINATFDPFVSP